jgi:SNF2 family DNA or RNA helicase
LVRKRGRGWRGWPVNIINLVVENTIEERVLEIIYQKQQLFAAMFDTDIDEINLAGRSRVEEMRELVRQLLETSRA